MAKVIKIAGNTIYIGNDNGSIQKVKRNDCDFKPALGDIVEVYTSKNQTIVIKSEESKNNERKNRLGTLSTQQSNQPNKIIVNKLEYCLITLFLGWLGIHKFYTGQIGLGFLYLLFCWTFIPAFISFVEFVLALCESPDEGGNIDISTF